MVTKLKKSSSVENTPVAEPVVANKKSGGGKKVATDKKNKVLASSVKDSAQQIWQAGLGAFTRAQVEGTKAFEALVKEGVSFQRKTQSAAEERITEATQKMTSMATDISSKASGQWDKLESIFEERVAKALNKLGVPSAKDVASLIARINELNDSVQKLTAAQAPAKPAPKKAAVKTEAASEVLAESPPAAVPAAKVARKPAARKTAARKTVTPDAAVTQENPQ